MTTLLRILGAVLVLVTAGALTGTAHAVNYNVTFCVLLDHDFVDAAPTITPGDDYENSNSYLTWARGVKVRVKKQFIGFDEWAMADWGGSTPGCSGPWSLNSSYTYNITVYSQALADDDNEIFVYDDDVTPAVYPYVYANFQPTSSTTVYIVVPAGDEWNILAAATWALYRTNGGVTAHDFEFVTEECPLGGGGGSCRTSDYIYIEPTSATPNGDGNGAPRRYIIVHEMGHEVAVARDEGENAEKDYTSSLDDDCWTDNGGTVAEETNGHAMIDKEYQSGAAVEGIAHYYAAVAFNDTTEDDCEFEYYKVTDWNVDTTNNDQNEARDPVAEANCNGPPYTTPDTGPAEDFLGNQCTGTLTGRATEYDYLRFLWDLTNTEGIPVTDVFDVWDAADPKDWCATPPCIPSSEKPNNRLQSAATAEGIGDEWSDQAETNGVHR